MNSPVDWLASASDIKSDDAKSSDEPCRVFSDRIRFFLRRKLGSRQLEQRVQETLAMLMSAINTEGRGEEQTLVQLVRAIILKQIDAYTAEDRQSRNETRNERGGISPDAIPDSTSVQDTVQRETRDAIIAVLGRISLRDREALVRFYSDKQAQAKICAEMRLSEEQFLLLKERFKAAVSGTTLTISESLPGARFSVMRSPGVTATSVEGS